MTTASLLLFDPGAIANRTPDEELIQRVLRGDVKEFAVLMRRHAQRLYRVCRSIVPNDREAEEALEGAYLRALSQLWQFHADAPFATWLTKVAVFEALARRAPELLLVPKRRDADQPRRADSLRLLEEAIDSLPPNYRTVYVLRQVEGLSVDETAACLLLSPQTVEARLQRAQRLLEGSLPAMALDQPNEQAFRFRGRRSAQLAERVMRTRTTAGSRVTAG